MTREQFFSSLESDLTAPPAECSPALQALWLVQSGHWSKAHDLCNHIDEPYGSWIHAYLHRVEGDLGNAAYWYSRAGKPTPPASVSLHAEWQSIVASIFAA